MDVTRIVVLCGCCLALGGCLSPAGTTRSYTALSPMAVSNDALQPVVEPGQLLNPNLGRTRAGVNPSDDLLKSQRARAAWQDQRLSELTLPPSMSAQTGSAGAGGGSLGIASTNSTASPTKRGTRRGAEAQPYNAETAMDRLERDGHRDAKPICSGC